MTDVKATGPVFNGDAAKAITDYCTHVEDIIAQQGVNDVKATLGRVLKHPTGWYQSRVVTDRSRNDRSVNDRHAVQGPWLEGTSSRNQTTRFKGYHTFRQVAQRLDSHAQRIAENEIKPFMRRMS